MPPENTGECTRAASAAAAAANVAGHAGVAVLGNRALLELITGFMVGYPFTVGKFYHEFNEMFLLQQGNNSPDSPQTARQPSSISTEYHESVMKGIDRIFSHSRGEIVLPHLAIAANDAEAFRVLYRVGKRPQYQAYPKLSFARVAEVAVLLNRVEMLELKADDPAWKWEWGLMGTALQRDDPDVRVLNWLSAHLPPGHFRPWFTTWKRSQGEATLRLSDGFANTIAEFQTKHDQLEAAKLFLEGEDKIDIPFMIDHVARSGHLGIVKYAHEHHSGSCRAQAIENAAAFGHLEVVKFLHENRSEGCTPDALSRAAENGHLGVVKFLHDKYGLECSTSAMDQTAANGHLKVLKFLLDNRIGTCSAAAMDGAAGGGHLQIVKFLYDNRSKGCTTNAMDGAAENGYLEIVKFLHFNRTEGCTANASTMSAKMGYGAVTGFLRGHRPEGNL